VKKVFEISGIPLSRIARSHNLILKIFIHDPRYEIQREIRIIFLVNIAVRGTAVSRFRDSNRKSGRV
jgi:hypothetical protein